tara:strand:+ start:5913 stop:6506 length:594 start_codon:yes stop_codon:yes gene_type:complete
MAMSLLKKFEGGLSFNEIESYTSKARTWYLKELEGLAVNRQALLKDTETRQRARLMPGRMFMFFYDPKHKETLPYYDRFPLVMVVDKVKGHPGFYGLNFHYLDYRKRAILLERLLQYKTNDRFDETTKLRLEYRTLKAAGKLKAYKPCFKHYLPRQTIGRIKEVPAEYWETVLFFPSEQFKKKTKNAVFAESRKAIR